MKIMLHHLLKIHALGMRKIVREFIKNVLHYCGSESGKNRDHFLNHNMNQGKASQNSLDTECR